MTQKNRATHFIRGLSYFRCTLLFWLPSTLGYTLETFSLYEKTPFKPNYLIYLTKENRSKEEADAIVKAIQKTFIKAGVHYLDFQVQQDKVENNDLLYAFDGTKTTITSLK